MNRLSIWRGSVALLRSIIVSLLAVSSTAAAAKAVPEARIAVLGGTFVNDAIFHRDGLIRSEFTIDTPVGRSPTIYYAVHEGIPFYYVHAHGQGRWLETWAALYDLGVEEAIGGATAGAIDRSMEVYDYVLVDDFIDLNVDRPIRIPKRAYRDPDAIPIPRFTPAVDTDIRAILLDETRNAILDDPDYEDIDIHDGGVVLQSRGGRFETVAEVEMMARLGGDLVTMNIASEMTYARMLGINYAAIGVISNPAEGRGDWDFSLMEELYPRINPLSLDIVLASLPRIAALEGKPRVDEGLINHPEMTSRQKNQE
jgi:5'-methylthioadenosine phosphorylase